MTEYCETVYVHSRLEGGAAEEDGISSSGSLDRLRPLRAAAPLFAADMLGRSGELMNVSSYLTARSLRRLEFGDVPHWNKYLESNCLLN